MQIKDLSIFHNLNDAEFKKSLVCTQSVVHEYKKNDYIFFQGDVPHKLYLILNGEVELGSINVNGKVLRITNISEGEDFGEVELFLNKDHYSGYAKAKSDVKLLEISKDFFGGRCEKNCSHHSKVVFNMLELFAKRTDENNQTSTMTYVDPETFQGYIDEYNGTGSESAKKNALTHFTLRRSTISTPTTGNNGGGNSGDNVDESKLFFVGDSWIDGLKNSGVAKSTTEYFYGVVGISAKDSGMSPATVISKVKDDASAIVLYLGVNGTGTYGDMNKLVDELANKYSNKTIYVVQVSHVDPNKYTAGFANNNDIDKYNENVKSHCEQVSNAKFLEVASSVQDDNGNLKNTSDGLHLNNYQDWYNSIITAINGNSGGTTTSGTNNGTTNNESNETRTNNRTNTGTTNNQGPKDTQVDGDGYTHEYTSSAGITYKCYKQGQGSYSTQRYWRDNPNGTIASSGCGPTSVAILTSGLKDPNITPSETASSMYERHRIYRG